jgi:hypothetical protein
MDIPRRQFLLTSGSIISGAVFGAQLGRAAGRPWYEEVSREGHANFTERDPLITDIEEWLDFWTSLKINALTLSGGGMMAFYPTRIPFHRKSRFLGDRDFFGDYLRAAKKRGFRVIARVTPTNTYGDAVKAHPEWFRRNSSGKAEPRDEFAKKGEEIQDDWTYDTCVFTTYYTEQIPAILRELNSMYDIDGFFINGFPTKSPQVCYCEVCRKIGDPKSSEYRGRYDDRSVEMVRLWDSITREKKPDNVYMVTMKGSINAVQNLRRLAEVSRCMNADNQARRDNQSRTGDAPIWQCAQTVRIMQSVMKGKPMCVSTGSNSTTRILWRDVSKNSPEVKIWWAQSVAGGCGLKCTWIGGKPQDLRWREPAREFFQWHARHEQHFANRRTIANLGIVFSQSLNGSYNPPRDTQPWEYMQGLYYALLEGRFVFDFVHEDDLGAETLKKYSALILPNVATMSDEQAGQLREYVASGGSLVSTFETGLFDKRGKPREDFALGDVFGIKRVGQRQGGLGGDSHSFYARIEKPHEILSGFEGTSVLPGAEYRVPVRAAGAPILTVIPPYPGHPPEYVYPRTPQTDEPAIVMVEKGPSRLVHFPGDVDRTSWRAAHPDVLRLLQNSIRWVLRNHMPVTVMGEGMTEVFAWETEPGYAVHILNYNNPNMTYGWFLRNYPIGSQKVTIQVPEGVRISKVELLRAETSLPFKQTGRTVEFVVPRVEDYEVAGLYASGRV